MENEEKTMKFKPTFWFSFTLYTNFVNTFINKVLLQNRDIKQYFIENVEDCPVVKMVQFHIKMIVGNHYRLLSWQFAVGYEDLWNIGVSKAKDYLDRMNNTNLMAIEFIEKCKQDINEKIEHLRYLYPNEFK